MLKKILIIGVSLVLSMAFLAACNGDDDGVDDVGDDPVTTDDTMADDPDDAMVDDPDDAMVDDEDEAVVDDEDEAVVDDEDEAVVDDEDEAAAEPIAVTLVDFQFEMDETIQGGTVVFEVTNDDEAPHGMAIESANGDNDEPIVSAEVEPGETEEVEVELEPGEYIVYCPVGNHREDGMETELTVE